MVANELNLALYNFISNNNFEKEKAEVNHKIKIYFKYFYDTSVGENTIDPKFKDTNAKKEIDPDMNTILKKL